jgi:two-component system, NtrC family, response regulator HydG
MPEQKRILVAEDDVTTHEDWCAMLASWGYEVKIAEDGEKALDLLRSFQPHILLSDLRMPHRDGLHLLRDIRELHLETLPIIISGVGEIPDAVQAIKLGAADYLSKPIDPPHLQQILKKVTEHIDVREENLRLRRRLVEVGELGPLFGKSLAMRRVLTSIERLAESSASVIITGESGTGKELAARTIHQLSSRKNAPFVGINCAAIPQTLMESELFGHERGAFTGADRRREGCFELANGGTLLLDEITEMKPELQAKLLRVIEERKLRRIGGTSEVDLDVRVLAASNRDLERAMHSGNLREDLYYRLNVFTIEMPPLCQRLEDLPLLIESFLQHFAELNHKQISGVDEECLVALKSHPWPGNVRQLRNVIERASVLCRGPLISIGDLPAEFKSDGQKAAGLFQIRLGTSLDDVERELISRTLEFAGGNKTRAAEILGITAKTLYNRLERYAADTKPSDT